MPANPRALFCLGTMHGIVSRLIPLLIQILAEHVFPGGTLSLLEPKKEAG